MATVPQIDFSPIGSLADVYRSAQQNERKRAALQQFAQTQDPNVLAASGDPNLANMAMTYMQRKAQAERQAAMDARQLERDKVLDARADRQFAQQQAYQNRSLGLQEAAAKRQALGVSDIVEQRRQAAARIGFTPDKPGYESYTLTGKMPREDAQPLTAGDKKAIMSAEDELPNIEGTLTALQTAKELNSKTLTGVTAGTRAFIGSSVPGGSMLVDKGAADATTEWQKIMGQESIKTMAETLKGATTDFELNTFVAQLGDPATPPQIRERIINRMIQLGQRKKEIAQRRINDMRGGNYYKPEGSMTRAPVQQTQGITQEQYNALPSGSVFTAPDGTQRVKP